MNVYRIVYRTLCGCTGIEQVELKELPEFRTKALMHDKGFRKFKLRSVNKPDGTLITFAEYLEVSL